jgi:hypothetical protein
MADALPWGSEAWETTCMAHEQEQRAALRILEGIEEGTMSAAESFDLIDAADPALVYLLLTWIRKHYDSSQPPGDAVISRLVEISNRYTAVAKKMKEGQADSLVEWFEDGYSYRELGSKEFVALIVDKMES